jgi:predicted RNA binding protein YcfA (HicA-like mRNA interferase family)
LLKLHVFSGQDLCRLSENRGFVQIRQRGSHFIMQKKIESSTFTVPVPNHNEIRKGTLRSIIRQSGLPRSIFEA